MKCFNNKTWMLGVVTVTLLVAVIMPSLPFASATHDSSICHTTIPSTIFEDMLVPAGTTCSTAPKAILTITGNVLIESGATFTVSSITVGGNVVADGAKFVAISNSKITGNLIVKSSGSSSSTVNITGGTIVNGNVQFEENTVKTLKVLDSRIDGNLQLNKNTAREIAVERSTIGGDIQFSENVSTDRKGNLVNLNTIGGDLIFFKNSATASFKNQGNQIMNNDIGGNLQFFENEAFGGFFSMGNQIMNNDIGGNLQFFENEALYGHKTSENNKIGDNDIGGNLDCADKNSVIDFTGPNEVTDPHVKTGECAYSY